jgi:SAM-dependent methyltransferase
MYSTLRKIAEEYPPDLVAGQIRDVPRIAFNISLAFGPSPETRASQLEVCDIGGGIGLFSVGCAGLGAKRMVLVDDFHDPVNFKVGASIFDLHRRHGVEVVSRDAIVSGIADLPGQFDAITTFDSMEHWHNSPKALFAQVVDKLKPGGVFVIGVPNCVNLRKRITLPFGKGKWSPMGEWYEMATFRGHVREPDVGDLHYIARDMGLRDVKIHGRNWQGYYSGNKLIRAATHVADHLLRPFPPLCSDIYMVGRKPA